MFGQYYAARDSELKALPLPERQLMYAQELLTELLNRAKTLQPIFERCVEADAGSADRLQYLEELAFAVDVFLKDVAEAEERGQRASLYAVTDFGVLDDACRGAGDLVPAEVAK